MRQNVVDILRYLPEFLQKDEIFKYTNDADSKEHERIRISLQDILDQCFVQTATWGLPVWEDLVGITDRTSATKKRRANIIAKLQASYSVTLQFMDDLINRYVINHAFTVTDVPSDYRVDIELQDGTVLDWNGLQQAIRTWIPAHLGWRFIAKTFTGGSINFGGHVSLADIITIGAQNEYNIDSPQSAAITGRGNVTVADYINISASI